MLEFGLGPVLGVGCWFRSSVARVWSRLLVVGIDLFDFSAADPFLFF